MYDFKMGEKMRKHVRWDDHNEDYNQVNVNAATPKQVIEWVQVMNEEPASTNPLNDPDGRFAELGDVGKTHYLAGTLGGSAEREFDVDLGDTLVLPLLNTWEWILGDFDNLKEAARSFFESAQPQDAYLRIDLDNDSTNEFDFDFDLTDSTYFPDLDIEKEARKFYVESKKDFVFYNPEDNINDIEEGYYDAYSVGYYARIKNLPEGTHRIEFGGSFHPDEADDPIRISVTDTITVVDSARDCLL